MQMHCIYGDGHPWWEYAKKVWDAYNVNLFSNETAIYINDFYYTEIKLGSPKEHAQCGVPI